MRQVVSACRSTVGVIGTHRRGLDPEKLSSLALRRKKKRRTTSLNASYCLPNRGARVLRVSRLRCRVTLIWL